MDSVSTKAGRELERIRHVQNLVKLTGFYLLGFAIWSNDLVGDLLMNLFNKTDKATQSSFFKWTVGFFYDDNLAISPIYEWYNVIATVVGVIGIYFVSKWFFWSSLKKNLDQGKYKKGMLTKSAWGFVFIWGMTYFLSGWFFQACLPSHLKAMAPVFPSISWFGFAGTALATIYYYENKECRDIVG